MDHNKDRLKVHVGDDGIVRYETGSGGGWAHANVVIGMCHSDSCLRLLISKENMPRPMKCTISSGSGEITS